jgi:hypothetical protein
MEEWVYRSTFLDLGTSWRRGVIFMSLSFYAQGKSPGTHWIAVGWTPKLVWTIWRS